MLNRLNHIAIAVSNLDEGIKIYKDTFGVQISKKLALPKNVETEAKEIIRFVEDSEYRQGISPIALLGASIYLACKKTKVRRSQLEIAKTLGTSEVTLRNRAKEINSLIKLL